MEQEVGSMHKYNSLKNNSFSRFFPAAPQAGAKSSRRSISVSIFKPV